MVEAEVVDFINDYKNDEYEDTIYSSPSKNRRGGIGRADKGGGFNELLGKNLRDINSKSWRTKKSLAWDFYKPYK